MRTSDSLIEALVMDCWPSPGAAVDFGLDNEDAQRRYAALQFLVRDRGVSADELHAIAGNGPRITALVRQHCPRALQADFATAWDNMQGDDYDD